MPAAFLERMARLLGDEYDAFAASYDRTPDAGLRLNTLKITPDAFAELAPFLLSPVPGLEAAYSVPEDALPSKLPIADRSTSAGRPTGRPAVNDTRPVGQAGKHPYHAAGLYYLQDPSAMVVAQLLAPQPGERVLDLAAAPGGKATHIATLMANQGLLVANEIHPKRVWDLAENIERWGATNVAITNETPERLADRFACFFDRVLLDAPCSGEGMFRKGDAARLEWGPELVQGCALRQRAILADAARMVRPGGILAYATCTFAPAEDEGTIAGFLDTAPDFELLEPVSLPGATCGRPDWLADGEARPELRRTVRLWPHTSPGEGHFVALLQRNPDAEPDDEVRPWRLPRLPAAVPALYLAFCRDTLVTVPAVGDLLLVGSYLYRVPPGLPDLTGLRFIHPGWWLGTLKKDRFEPSHALALALRPDDVRRAVDFGATDPRALAFLRGESVARAGEDGWTLVTVDGFPLGWGKQVKGTLKSHYPRGLRWM